MSAIFAVAGAIGLASTLHLSGWATTWIAVLAYGLAPYSGRN